MALRSRSRSPTRGELGFHVCVAPARAYSLLACGPGAEEGVGGGCGLSSVPEPMPVEATRWNATAEGIEGG